MKKTSHAPIPTTTNAQEKTMNTSKKHQFGSDRNRIRRRAGLALWAGLALATAGSAQVVPEQIDYHGTIAVNNTNYNGIGSFKFALIQKTPYALLPTTRWSNDGTLSGEPTSAVDLDVVDGQFSVVLGGEKPDMKPIPAGTFARPTMFLRVWFDDGTNGVVQLEPDQPMTSVPYAMMAAQVENDAIGGSQIAPDAIDDTHLDDDAVTSAALADGSVTTPKLADLAVTTPKLADDAVNAAKLAGNSVNSSHIVNNSVTSDDIAATLELGELYLGGGFYQGRLQLLDASGDDRGLLLATPNGATMDLVSNDGRTGLELSSRLNEGGDVDVFQANGQFGVRLNGDTGPKGGSNESLSSGEVTVHGRVGLIGVRASGEYEGAGRVEVLYPNQQTGIDLEGFAGRVTLRQPNGTGTVGIESAGGPSNGGQLSLSQSDGQVGAVLYGASPNDGVGALSLRDADGEVRLRLYGGPEYGSFHLLRENETPILTGRANNNGDGLVNVANHDGDMRVLLLGSETDGSDGSSIQLFEDNGAGDPVRVATMVANEGGELWLFPSDGAEASVILDADSNGEGRVITDVLEIRGGSDLSENFDIAAEGSPEPGMLVCIDDEHPGELKVSEQACDRTVVGVISGAGGVKPGMLMGQRGTVADGAHPVALTGRVYCQVDAGFGAIEPGDLITTSGTPGHGMKVREQDHAHGAIVGKAMTGLEEGRGLVLVLVSLH